MRRRAPHASRPRSFHNVKTSAYKKGPELFDEWCGRHNVEREAIPLLKAMLQLDPSKRITALEASLVRGCRWRCHWCAACAGTAGLPVLRGCSGMLLPCEPAHTARAAP